MRRPWSLILLHGLVASLSHGSENGRSTYSAATQGDFSLAVLPEKPGLYLRNETYTYAGRNTFSSAAAALRVTSDLRAYVDIPRLTWSSEWELLGARYGAYFSLPVAGVEAKTTIRQGLPGGGELVRRQEGERYGFSDFYLAPVILDWKLGSVDLMLLETLTIPSGTYDRGETVNISRNHFALNSSLAATWRHPDGGPELDLRMGYIVNSENPATDYRTGDELVADWTAAWRLTASWAVGLTGYAYQQVTGDSGDGAVLGDFRARSVGVGPIGRYIFDVGDHRFSLVAKWLHEVDAHNRFEGDFFFLAISTRL